jgi:hypothetical protein
MIPRSKLNLQETLTAAGNSQCGNDGVNAKPDVPVSTGSAVPATEAPVLTPAKTHEAVCRVCGQPFIANRTASGCWVEVCKRRGCRGAGLFAAQSRLPHAPAILRVNEIDGGGQRGRFRMKKPYWEWN